MASITNRFPFNRRNDDGQPSPDQGGPEDPDLEEDPAHFLEMTLQEHLEELRTRILYAVVGVLVALIGSFFLVDVVLEAIAVQANAPDDGIASFSPTEGFVTWFKVLLYIAIALAMPLLAYQFLAFIMPGLTRTEQRWLKMAIPMISVLFVAGIAFAFFLAIPRALEFLSGFKSDIFSWDPRASELVTFYLRLMLGMGIAFELPAVMFILSKVGVVNHQRLASARKIAFILVLIAAAIITPTPDPFNMMIVAAPIYFLYELGVFLARFA